MHVIAHRFQVLDLASLMVKHPMEAAPAANAPNAPNVDAPPSAVPPPQPRVAGAGPSYM